MMNMTAYLKNKVYYSSILIVLFLSACATPYEGIKEPAPLSWLGDSGMIAHLDTLKIISGMHHENDAIIEYEISLKRTGLVANTVQLKTAFGGDLIIKKGSIAYAMDFSVVRTNAYSYSGTDMQAGFDPIEWCIILKNGASGKDDEPVLYCLLWESSQSSRYIKMYGPYVYSPFLFSQASGMAGPVPVINEQKVDLGVTLKKQFQIDSINSKSISLKWTESDGVNNKYTTRASKIKYKWDNKGEVQVKNRFGNLLIHKIDDKSVEVFVQ